MSFFQKIIEKKKSSTFYYIGNPKRKISTKIYCDPFSGTVLQYFQTVYNEGLILDYDFVSSNAKVHTALPDTTQSVVD